jgi:putative transposase
LRGWESAGGNGGDPHRAKLDLPAALRSFLVTTNAIENLIGTSRRISRNVKRWRSGEMIVRWTAIGLAHAEKNFRRVRGCRYLPFLASALRHHAVKIEQSEEAA